MADDYTRSEYLKIMLGNTQDKSAGVPVVSPEQINDVGGVQNGFSYAVDSSTQAVENAQERAKASSTRNGWQRFQDTLSDINNDFWNGFLGFIDSIGDFSINVLKEMGAFTGEQAEQYKNTNWQGSVEKLYNFPNAVMSGDLFSPDYWKFDSDSVTQWQADTNESSLTSYLPAEVRNFGAGIVQNIGNMVPAMITSTLSPVGSVAKALSLGTLGTGAFAQTANEKYEENGGDMGKAVASGLVDAGIEVGTELFVQPILAPLGLANPDFQLNGFSIGTQSAYQMAKAGSAGAKETFVRLLRTANEEGMEEIVSGILSPIVDYVGGDKNAFASKEGKGNRYLDTSFWIGGEDSVAMQGLSGAVLGLVMDSPTTFANSREAKKYFGNKNVMNAYVDTVDALDVSGKSADEVASAVEKATNSLKAVMADDSVTAEQKSALLEAVRDPRRFAETYKTDEINDAIADEIKTINDPGKFKAVTAFNAMTEAIPSAFSLKFGKLGDGKYAEIKGNTITLSDNLGSEVYETIAHEYIGHGLLSNLSSSETSELYDEVAKTGWFKENEKRISEAYADKGENVKKQETIASYVETLFGKTDDLDTDNAVLKSLLAKKNPLTALADFLTNKKARGLLDNSSVSKTLGRAISALVSKGVSNDRFAEIWRAVQQGEELKGTDKEFYEQHEGLFNLLAEYDKRVSSKEEVRTFEHGKSSFGVRHGGSYFLQAISKNVGEAYSQAFEKWFNGDAFDSDTAYDIYKKKAVIDPKNRYTEINLKIGGDDVKAYVGNYNGKANTKADPIIDRIFFTFDDGTALGVSYVVEGEEKKGRYLPITDWESIGVPYKYDPETGDPIYYKGVNVKGVEADMATIRDIIDGKITGEKAVRNSVRVFERIKERFGESEAFRVLTGLDEKSMAELEEKYAEKSPAYAERMETENAEKVSYATHGVREGDGYSSLKVPYDFESTDKDLTFDSIVDKVRNFNESTRHTDSEDGKTRTYDYSKWRAVFEKDENGDYVLKSFDVRETENESAEQKAVTETETEAEEKSAAKKTEAVNKLRVAVTDSAKYIEMKAQSQADWTVKLKDVTDFLKVFTGITSPRKGFSDSLLDNARDYFKALNDMKASDRDLILTNIADSVADYYNVPDKGTAELTTGKEEIGVASADERSALVSEIKKLLGDLVDFKGKETFRKKVTDRLNYVTERNSLIVQVNRAYSALNNKVAKARFADMGAKDIEFLTEIKSLVGKNPLSSRLGITTGARDRMFSLHETYTEANYADSVMGFNPAIRQLIDQYWNLYHDSDGNVYRTARGVDSTTYNNGATNDEIAIMRDFFKAVSKHYSDTALNLRQKRIERAQRGVSSVRLLLTKRKQGTRFNVIKWLVQSAISPVDSIGTFVGEESDLYKVLSDGITLENGEKVGWNISEQERARKQRDYSRAIEDIYGEEGVKTSSFGKEVKGFTDSTGKTFKGITKDMIASMYYSAKTRGDILSKYGHIRFQYDYKGLKQVVTLDGDYESALKGYLTDAEWKATSRISEEIMNGKATADYSRWYEKTFGVKPDNLEKDYFTTSVDNGSVNIADPAEQTNALFGSPALSTASWGKAKTRVTTDNELRLGGFNATVSRYVSDLAYMESYTTLLETVRTMLNTKVDGKNLNMLLAEYVPNWKKSSTRQKGLGNYLVHALLGDRSYLQSDLVMKMTNSFQSAVLGLNPSSVMKQPLSAFTIMGESGISNWLKAMPRMAYNLSHYRETNELIKKYVPLFEERVEEGGFYEGVLSSNAVNRLQKATMWAMEKTDEATNVISVWAVAQTMAKQEMPSETYASEKLNERAGEIFTNLLLDTQSNNNIQRTSPLRAGYLGRITKILFGLFSSDNQNKAQLFNRVLLGQRQAEERIGAYESILADESVSEGEKAAIREQYEEAKSLYSASEWRKKATGVSTALVLNAVGTLLVALLMERLKGKKDWTEKELQDELSDPKYWWDAYSELFFNWIPYVSTFSNAITNNTDVSFFTLDKMNEIVGGFTDLYEASAEGNAESILRASRRLLVLYVPQMVGIPSQNLYNYLTGAWKMIPSGTAEEMQFESLFRSLSSTAMIQNYKTYVGREDMTRAIETLEVNYPLYKTGSVSREVLKEISMLYKEGNTNVLAKNVPDYYMDGEGNQITLTTAQKRDFQKSYSEANKAVEGLLSSAYYSRLSSEEKAKAIKKVYNAYYDRAMGELKGETEIGSKLGLLATSKNVSAGELGKISAVVQLVKSTNRNGRTGAVAIVNRTNLTRAERLAVLWLLGYSLDENAGAEASKKLGIEMQ